MISINDLTPQEFRYIWDKSGKYGPGENETIKLKDALSTTNAPIFIPQTITNIIKEAVEPLMIGTSLLTRINYVSGQTITFPATGAMVAYDMAEGQEYQEQGFAMGGSTVIANIGKTGMAVKLSEEMIENSQFDIIGMLLRSAGKAMARHKEEKIWNYINALGTPLFDNAQPTQSLFGVTTGRDLQGAANGSITLDDIFDGFGQLVLQGYTPNLLILNPLAWTMFVKDPQMRAFVQANGGGSWFGGWSGNPAGQAPWGASSMGGLGLAGGQSLMPAMTSTGVASPSGLTASLLPAYPQTINSAPQLPPQMNIPFQIVVSPYVPYDPLKKTTTVIIASRGDIGAIAVKEDLRIEEWRDPKVDMLKIKLREKYAISILNEGLGCGVFRNVKCVPNEVILPAQTTIDISGSSFSKISPTTSISL